MTPTITGYPNSALPAEAMELGPLALMKKPFTAHQILQAIQLCVCSGVRGGPGPTTELAGTARRL